MNINLNPLQWTQTTLPISFGGLGIRRPEDISLPAFISSSYGVKSHVSHILNFQDEILMKLIKNGKTEMTIENLL